jgi:hypothetical protein
MIIDSDDYYDDDGYWEEYFTISSNNFELIINRLENNYKPVKAFNLDNQMISKLDSLKTINAKFMFLYILAINKYKKYLSEEENKNYRGKELIKILCGDDIEYGHDIYSKGP